MTDIEKMNLDEIRAFVYDDLEKAQRHEHEVKDRLYSFCWDIGILHDRVGGVDSTAGPESRYGTRNRKSMTYKLRKAIGYSYP